MGFTKYRSRFDKTNNHLTQTSGLSLKTYPKAQFYQNLQLNFFLISAYKTTIYRLQKSGLSKNFKNSKSAILTKISIRFSGSLSFSFISFIFKMLLGYNINKGNHAGRIKVMIQQIIFIFNSSYTQHYSVIDHMQLSITSN